MEKFLRNEQSTLEQLLREAEAQALEKSEVDANDEKEAKVLNDFISGKKSLAEYHECDPRGDELMPGEVLLSSLADLKRALKLLIGDEELVNELTEHEADHYREAVRLGFNPKILIRFIGKEHLRPAIQFNLPKEGDEEILRNHLRIIIEAPIELSDLDKEQSK